MPQRAYELMPAAPARVVAASHRAVHVVLPRRSEVAVGIDFAQHRPQPVVEIPAHRRGDVVPSVLRPPRADQVDGDVRAGAMVPLPHEHAVVQNVVRRRPVCGHLPPQSVGAVSETTGDRAVHTSDV